jgi:hypothetical protein
MSDKCWICNVNKAESGEHVIMKSAFEKLLGKPEKDKNRFFIYKAERKKRMIGSFKNDQLKFDKSICTQCNGALTQPYDNEFMSFIGKLIRSKTLIVSRNKLAFNSFNKINLALYFIKIFGCLLKENDGLIEERDFELIRQSLLRGKVLTDNIYLSAHRDLDKLAALGAKSIGHCPVLEKTFCSWIIDLDWISLVISYPFPPIQNEWGMPWNLGEDVISLTLGKFG